MADDRDSSIILFNIDCQSATIYLTPSSGDLIDFLFTVFPPDADFRYYVENSIFEI
jgi:hypothetical protein